MGKHLVRNADNGLRIARAYVGTARWQAHAEDTKAPQRQVFVCKRYHEWGMFSSP